MKHSVYETMGAIANEWLMGSDRLRGRVSHIRIVHNIDPARNRYPVSYVSMVSSNGIFSLVIQSMHISSGVKLYRIYGLYVFAVNFGWTAHLGFGRISG